MLQLLGLVEGSKDDLVVPMQGRSHSVQSAVNTVNTTRHTFIQHWITNPWICNYAWSLDLYHLLHEFDTAYPDPRRSSIPPLEYIRFDKGHSLPCCRVIWIVYAEGRNNIRYYLPFVSHHVRRYRVTRPYHTMVSTTVLGTAGRG